ncbi:MAG: thioredoxin domain-containing protein [Candidatus Limnocylindrales bacterium]
MVEPSAVPSGTPAAHTNRLAGETSPYLLQHAHNPVDWFPWGPEAFERARLLDRPIFLSIGYAACHWCHVMERESFEDPATAADLNRSFVAIKVDREERPDLDALYMDAVQALTGQGGWPMNTFLTPDGRPFYGGTYFPPERRHGLPAFREVLASIALAWYDDRAAVEAAATRLAEAVAAAQGGPAGQAAHPTGPGRLMGLDGRPLVGRPPPALSVDQALLEAAVEEIERGFDPQGGGWGATPKFPQPMTLEFLLRRHLATGSELPLAIAHRSLEAMAAGGIYDQLGGGFARYATDAAWLVPHFEKMLYDNAQLARVYLHAWQVTGEARYRAVTEETLDYLLREMAEPDGTFGASQDADTAGVEGGSYTWAAAEVAARLGPDGALFAAAYDVTAAGNWEGRTILRRVASDAALAVHHGLTEAEVGRRLAEARQRLLVARQERPQPARDDKALAAWNGLALAALAEASAAFGRADYRAAAERAANALLTHLPGPDGRLGRSWKDGRVSQAGVLEDHADLAEGLLALYQATFEERWFVAARDLLERVLAHFADPAGGFFDTADDHERLIARPKGLTDNALPSGNAMAATALLRLAALTGEGRYRTAAEQALGLVTGLVGRYATAFAQWLVALDLAARPIDEVAIVGAPEEADTQALLRAVRSRYRPQLVLASTTPLAETTSAVPLLHGRPQLDGRATAYVCRAFACQRPVTSPGDLEAQLG